MTIEKENIKEKKRQLRWLKKRKTIWLLFLERKKRIINREKEKYLNFRFS
jgi:hypothetical protein